MPKPDPRAIERAAVSADAAQLEALADILRSVGKGNSAELLERITRRIRKRAGLPVREEVRHAG